MPAINLIGNFLTVSREKLQAVKGLGEALGISAEFVIDAVKQLMAFDTLSGAEKRELVLKAVGELFDFLVTKIALPWYLRWLLWFKTPAARQAALDAAARLLEAFYAQIK